MKAKGYEFMFQSTFAILSCMIIVLAIKTPTAGCDSIRSMAVFLFYFERNNVRCQQFSDVNSNRESLKETSACTYSRGNVPAKVQRQQRFRKHSSAKATDLVLL